MEKKLDTFGNNIFDKLVNHNEDSVWLKKVN